MKQKDVATIVAIVFFSGVISFFASNVLISSPKNRQQKVEIVEKIGEEFTRPDTKYFNDKAINPTQKIQISENGNKQPFNNPNSAQ
jgi:hypothetical protein